MEVWSALQTPRRREILRLIWEKELCAGEICRRQQDVTFGAVSQHLKVLEKAGLVRRRDEGRSRYYLANKEKLGSIRQYLEEMWDASLYRLKIRAELEQARRGPQSRKKRRK